MVMTVVVVSVTGGAVLVFGSVDLKDFMQEATSQVEKLLLSF